MIKGSRNRVYDAYELLPQRALWLRVIAPISKAELAPKLPRGVRSKRRVLPRRRAAPHGRVRRSSSPSTRSRCCRRETGEAVVGNDHTRVFIEAIGIDQKSGIYVRDLTTGEVRLVRGKQSYLVDPRKEVQITRTVPPEDWNLWIAADEPHKDTGAPMTTPWAVSMIVPHNTAVLATSADGAARHRGPVRDAARLRGDAHAACCSRRARPRATTSAAADLLPAHRGQPRLRHHRRRDGATSCASACATRYSVTFLRRAQGPLVQPRELHPGDVRSPALDRAQPRCRTLRCRAVAADPRRRARHHPRRAQRTGGRPGRGVFAENGMIVTEVEVLSAIDRGRDDRRDDAAGAARVGDAAHRRPAGAGDAGLGEAPRRARAADAGARPRRRRSARRSSRS